MSEDPIFICSFTAQKTWTTRPPTVDVVYSFPLDKEKLLSQYAMITDFCFPESEEFSAQYRESFTFTLTDGSGARLYGFCLRAKGPYVCHCVLSERPWFKLFSQVLDREHATGQDCGTIFPVLYSIALRSGGDGQLLECGDGVSIQVEAPDERIPLSDAPLSDLFDTFGTSGTLKLFAAVLEERRILLTCSNLTRLTACAHALVAIMYPLRWPHVFIPVLPPKLVDALCSPTPFIIGIHRELLHKVPELPTNAMVQADLDRGKVVKVDGQSPEDLADDFLTLPNHDELKSRLKHVIEKHTDSKGNISHLPSYDVLGCFVAFFRPPIQQDAST